jgi:hypothetical protein
MGIPMTHKYIPRQEPNEENLFIEEYYSSTDVKIYIDDEEQTEIGYINYSLREQLKPIYGYSSRTFDDVAVGNRIVTGMIKIPIKNPEAQTSLLSIIEQGTESIVSSHYSYNENQQELKNAIDWITGENENVTNKDESLVDEEVSFEYKSKLILLGYNLNYNSTSTTLKQQIKQFQKDHELFEDGLLTTETMKEIDKQIENKELSKITLPKKTKIYLKPIFSSSSIKTKEKQEVYLIDSNYGDGWAYIRTEDGEEGYINMKEVE